MGLKSRGAFWRPSDHVGPLGFRSLLDVGLETAMILYLIAESTTATFEIPCRSRGGFWLVVSLADVERGYAPVHLKCISFPTLLNLFLCKYMNLVLRCQPTYHCRSNGSSPSLGRLCVASPEIVEVRNRAVRVKTVPLAFILAIWAGEICQRFRFSA